MALMIERIDRSNPPGVSICRITSWLPSLAARDAAHDVVGVGGTDRTVNGEQGDGRVRGGGRQHARQQHHANEQAQQTVEQGVNRSDHGTWPHPY
jgi:hypothetical protein